MANWFRLESRVPILTTNLLIPLKRGKLSLGGLWLKVTEKLLFHFMLRISCRGLKTVKDWAGPEKTALQPQPRRGVEISFRSLNRRDSSGSDLAGARTSIYVTKSYGKRLLTTHYDLCIIDFNFNLRWTKKRRRNETKKSDWFAWNSRFQERKILARYQSSNTQSSYNCCEMLISEIPSKSRHHSDLSVAWECVSWFGEPFLRRLVSTATSFCLWRIYISIISY